MDQQRIKALIDLMATSDLVELNFTEDNCSLQLLRDPSAVCAPQAAPITAALSGADSASGRHIQHASFYGVIHLTPAPAKPPFVQSGDRIEQGQTLGLLEAMKMFHPLTAEYSGTLEAILVNAGDEVEAEQPLFHILKDQ